MTEGLVCAPAAGLEGIDMDPEPFDGDLSPYQAQMIELVWWLHGERRCCVPLIRQARWMPTTAKTQAPAGANCRPAPAVTLAHPPPWWPARLQAWATTSLPRRTTTCRHG